MTVVAGDIVEDTTAPPPVLHPPRAVGQSPALTAIVGTGDERESVIPRLDHRRLKAGEDRDVKTMMVCCN